MPTYTDQPGYDIPASLQAETAILGAMMIDPVAILDATAKLRAEDFSLDSHRRVFTAITSLAASGENVDSITVREALNRKKELDSIGGPAYLAFLGEGLPRNFNIESYVRIVKGKSLLRQLMSTFHDGEVRASDQGEDPEELGETIVASVRGILSGTGADDLQTAGEFIAERERQGKTILDVARVNGIKTGMVGLDELSGGLHGFVVVGARPSMGKTAWACNVVYNLSVVQQKKVAFFTLEQDTWAALRRIISSSGRINFTEMLAGSLSSRDLRIAEERQEDIRNSFLVICDRQKMTVTRLRSILLRHQLRHGLDAVFIDQLSMLSRKDVQAKGMLKAEAVGEQVKALAELQKELGIPVVVLNQLKREADGAPKLSDLKETGSLEEYADQVIFLDRPAYHDRKNAELKGVATQIVAKNRDGATGEVACEYHGNYVRWVDEGKPQTGFSMMTDDEAYRSAYSGDGERSHWQ